MKAMPLMFRAIVRCFVRPVTSACVVLTESHVFQG